MSRSYKKFPWVKDRDSSKWGKKYCNSKLEKLKMFLMAVHIKK